MKYTILIFAVLSGCAFNGHLVKQCPGGVKLITIEESKSSNPYLARASEEARLLAKCAQIDIEEKIEESRKAQ